MDAFFVTRSKHVYILFESFRDPFKVQWQLYGQMNRQMLRSFKLDQQDNLKYITRDFGTMVASFKPQTTGGQLKSPKTY